MLSVSLDVSRGTVDDISEALISQLRQSQSLVCNKAGKYPEETITAIFDSMQKRSLESRVASNDPFRKLKIFSFHTADMDFEERFLSELTDFIGKVPEYIEDMKINAVYSKFKTGDFSRFYDGGFGRSLTRFLVDYFGNPPNWENRETLRHEGRESIPLLVPIFDFRWQVGDRAKENEALESYLRKMHTKDGVRTSNKRLNPYEKEVADRYGGMVGFVFDLLNAREDTLGEKPYQVVAAPLHCADVVYPDYAGQNWIKTWANSRVVYHEFAVAHIARKI